MARKQNAETRKASASENTTVIHLVDIPDPANNETWRITDWTESIKFPESGGDTYDPFTFEFESIPIDQSDQVERTRVSATNVTLEMRSILRRNNGLQDEDIRVRKVHPWILGGEDDVIFDVTYKVEQATWSQQDATLDLRSPFDRAHRRLTNSVTRERFPGIPRRRAIVR